MAKALWIALRRTFGWYSIPACLAAAVWASRAGLVYATVAAVALHLPLFFMRGLPVIIGARTVRLALRDGEPQFSEGDIHPTLSLGEMSKIGLSKMQARANTADVAVFICCMLGIRDNQRKMAAGFAVPRSMFKELASLLNVHPGAVEMLADDFISYGFLKRGPLYRGELTLLRHRGVRFIVNEFDRLESDVKIGLA